MTTEKRTSERLAFAKGDEVRVVLEPVSGRVRLEARILNVSRGGIGLAADRNEKLNLDRESQLRLLDIDAGTGLLCLQGQEVRVKWVLDYEPLQNLGIGCEFVNIHDDCLQEIEALFDKDL
ncbi:MAG TPA: PilZ domain-containing protein [Desulfopila sp.]|nr:PilZ domain-containing protein [Desulfopila sp.]